MQALRCYTGYENIVSRNEAVEALIANYPEANKGSEITWTVLGLGGGAGVSYIACATLKIGVTLTNPIVGGGAVLCGLVSCYYRNTQNTYIELTSKLNTIQNLVSKLIIAKVDNQQPDLATIWDDFKENARKNNYFNGNYDRFNFIINATEFSKFDYFEGKRGLGIKTALTFLIGIAHAPTLEKDRDHLLDVIQLHFNRKVDNDLDDIVNNTIYKLNCDLI